MAPASQAASYQIGTRARNKLTHPGNVSKPAPRRSSAEVQQERDKKAKAKAVHDTAKKKGIIRAAKFEKADMANEDITDTTPHPPSLQSHGHPITTKKVLPLTLSLSQSRGSIQIPMTQHQLLLSWSLGMNQKATIQRRALPPKNRRLWSKRRPQLPCEQLEQMKK